MKGTSKVIMGATLVMVLSLAIVLGLVLVLLAELYCSLLLRRRQINLSKNPTTTTTPTPAIATSSNHGTQFLSPLSSFYAQGVLHAPRNLFFPNQDDVIPDNDDVERQHGKLHEFLSLQTALDSDKPDPQTDHHLVYISNPVYDNDAVRSSAGDHTPFETPDTSPSRFGDKEVEMTMTTTTPPLTPMKALPAKASSVAMSIGTSTISGGSEESNSQNAAFSPTTYTGSPSCSSSW